MAFDRTNPTDLLALKNERLLDPIRMGYSNNDNQFIRQINDPDSNTGGETTQRTFDASALLDALVPGELDAAQTDGSAGMYTQMLLTKASTFDGDISAYRTKWRALFAANSSTAQALDAQNRRLSRAEVLFGIGTVLVIADWLAPRDS